MVREYLSKCYNKQLPRARECACVRQCIYVRVHDASECACVRVGDFAAHVFANVVVHDCAPWMSLVFKFKFGFSKL